ncbi:response regulator [Oceanibacterium hippocampi]|uniref:Nitrogen assimilation regulatory protein n=1 Tax=Oceanibacterium hippocampi TaxID=745714 RepID=A0A1Y5S9S4_9PROT|nr:response regulator [Oceanibacterium hippocampi]SLN35042.1 Nitrogen assimilation regulatory protein [Oceanibacterium hippocampi]
MSRILLAEDDDSMRLFLARELERAGHEVTAVADGVDALPMLGPGRFDVLVSDLVMPEVDGLALAQRATAADPLLKVIFITGFSGVALKASESMRGIPVLSKPFHLKTLVEAVGEALASEQPPLRPTR